MNYDIQDIDYVAIERRAREERALAMKAGLISAKAAVKNFFANLSFAGQKTA
ncbi:MAG: hypothetical protein AAF700_11050 [Pseudomonadota bacterium]